MFNTHPIVLMTVAAYSMDPAKSQSVAFTIPTCCCNTEISPRVSATWEWISAHVTLAQPSMYSKSELFKCCSSASSVYRRFRINIGHQRSM